MSLPRPADTVYFSRAAVVYSAALPAFSVFARDILNFLILHFGRPALAIAVWGIFLAAAYAIARLGRALDTRGWCLLAAVLVLGACYAASFEVFEERTHLVKYGLLAFLIARSNPGCRPWRLASTIVAASLWVACWDETVQYFTPGRVGDPRDVLFDCVGAVWGLSLWFALNLSRKVRI